MGVGGNPEALLMPVLDAAILKRLGRKAQIQSPRDPHIHHTTET